MKKILVVFISILILMPEVKSSTTSASSYILMDQNTGRVLLSKDKDSQRLIASITKIMTCILALESGKSEDVVIVDDNATSAYGSGIYIEVGEEIKLKDLLYGLMLRSGNDAASMIAAYVSGSIEEFVKLTGVDSLAVAIGTSHGAYKFKPGQKPQLRFDILNEIERKLPDFPIVLHGASSVIPKYVNEINEFGGKLDEAVGIPEEMLRKAAKSAVCKINVDSDLRLAMTASIRKSFSEHPENFDPRKYLSAARTSIEEVVKHKIENVMGSKNKA